MRTCAGCGRQAPQRELLRFAMREGELVYGRSEPGRGVYTCRSLACFERAAESGMFARVLRRSVRVDPFLRRLYTEEVDGELGK